jgi:hypothetical protein
MINQRIFIGTLLLALLLSSSGTIYYKLRAAHYETRWAETMHQLSLKNAPAKQPETPQYLPATNSPEDLMKEFDVLLLELEQKDRELAKLKSRTNRTTRARDLPSAEERQSRMEELKKTDPEAYKEIMTRWEERQTRIQTAFAERAGTLLERTPPHLSEQEREERELMLQTLDETWRLTEQMTSPDTPREERHEIRTELSEKSKVLKPLLENERDRQLYELGTASGYSEDEAELFVDYIYETIKATSVPKQNRRR